MGEEKKIRRGWISKKRSLFLILVFSISILGASFYWFVVGNEWLVKDLSKQTEIKIQQDKFDDLYLNIQSAESAVRGYASTGNKKYVKKFGSILFSIRSDYKELRTHLQRDNTLISETVFALFDSLIREKVAFMELAKKRCDENDCVGALELIATERGIELTTAILAINKKTNTKIRETLNASKKQFALINKRNNNIAYAGIIAALITILLTIYLLRNEIQRTAIIAEQLRLQKDYLGITLNSIGEGLIATDRESRIVFMNPVAERLTGWTNKEARNKPLNDVYNVFVEDTGKPFNNIVKRILSEGVTIDFENNTILKTKNNESLVISNTGSPLKNKEGKIEGAVLVFNDITQNVVDKNKLKESELKFKELIYNLPEAVYTCDQDGYIQFYNNAAVKLWGKEPVAGKDKWCGSWKIFNPDGSELSLEKCPMAIALKEAKPVYGKEVLVQRPDGEMRHVLPSPTPMFNKKGKLTGAVNMLIDVTAKKEREILIRKTEEKYKNLFNQASDAIIIYSLDGTIHEFNDVILTISGYTREEFLKLNLNDLIIGDMVQDVKKVEQIMAGKSITISRQFKQKDGTIIDLESKAKMIADGKILAFGRDVTQRKKAQTELRNLKESYLALINNVDGIVWEADAKTFEFSFVSSKAERLLGYSISKWIDEPTFWADHIHKDDKTWAVDYCIQCTKDKLSHDFEYRMVAADGSTIWLRDMVSVQVENDEPVKLIGIKVDITNQKLSEKEKEEKNKQLQLLAEHLQKVREEERTSIAREIHDELGQQLVIMKMDVAWLEEKLGKENEALLNRTHELKNMLDMTVTTVRRIAYQLRPSILDDMGLAAAIEWQLNEFEKRAEVRTSFEGVRKTFPISGNARTGLFRIVQEALTNVGRYANAKNVNVSLAEVDGNMELIITDDGIGFDIKTLAIKKAFGIVGMKERCLMLDGEFKIESSIGKGTVIKIRIPINTSLN